MEVSASGLWSWLNRPLSQRKVQDAEISELILASHSATDGIYGEPRIRADVKEAGINASRRRVARIMRELGIEGVSGRTRIRVKTTISNPDHPKASNILNRDFKADKPNQRWVTDITVIDTDEGRLYLAAIEDLFSRKVVGWAIDTHMETSLVTRALRSAISLRHVAPGLLHHSDRGCQYTSDEYQQLLNDYTMTPSMSRKGNCHDNACAESFWARLKVECIYRTTYPTRAAARAAVFRYIEVFYNRIRRHSALGYLSPDAFEARYANAAQAGWHHAQPRSSAAERRQHDAQPCGWAS